MVMMYEFYLILFFIFMSFFMLMYFVKHLLMMLVVMEFILVGMMYFMFFVFNYLDMNYSFFIYFMVLGVCEGVMGLSLMVIMMRMFGNDYIKVLSLM
uniref:NADH-ubiquinone oxidoreductase chain 4L n=1 Tax=Gasteruption sp. M19 TaxID=162239 RepID=A0A096XMY0_9HYME|nr:NADH dehydrogenase subunit 4L [Gasteruption sp. M19]